jgi:hypothetical protein
MGGSGWVPRCLVPLGLDHLNVDSFTPWGRPTVLDTGKHSPQSIVTF